MGQNVGCAVRTVKAVSARLLEGRAPSRPRESPAVIPDSDPTSIMTVIPAKAEI